MLVRKLGELVCREGRANREFCTVEQQCALCGQAVVCDLENDLVGFGVHVAEAKQALAEALAVIGTRYNAGAGGYAAFRNRPDGIGFADRGRIVDCGYGQIAFVQSERKRCAASSGSVLSDEFDFQRVGVIALGAVAVLVWCEVKLFECSFNLGQAARQRDGFAAVGTRRNAGFTIANDGVTDAYGASCNGDLQAHAGGVVAIANTQAGEANLFIFLGDDDWLVGVHSFVGDRGCAV